MAEHTMTVSIGPGEYSPTLESHRMRRRTWALIAVIGVALAPLPGAAADSAASIKVGLIATTSVEKVTADWKPLTDALTRELQMPVKVVASKDYKDIADALKDGGIQVAWINNKLGVEAVETNKASVFAQMVRLDGSRGYRSVLLARKNSGINSAADVINQPKILRFGSGDKKSTSGYLVPNYYVFSKNKIDPAKHFKTVTQGNHLDNFLAVANGQVDVATNNTEEIPRYQAEFADKFANVKVIWESPLIPNDPIMYRNDLPEPLKNRIKKFFLAYGQNEAEKSTLKNINGLSGFRGSSNYQLRPIVDLELFQLLSAKMVEYADSPAKFQEAMGEISKRASHLDSILNATRQDAP